MSAHVCTSSCQGGSIPQTGVFGETDNVWHRAISVFFYRAQWLKHRIEMTVEAEAIKRKHFVYNTIAGTELSKQRGWTEQIDGVSRQANLPNNLFLP
jgi:hypothetical protein